MTGRFDVGDARYAVLRQGPLQVDELVWWMCTRADPRVDVAGMTVPGRTGFATLADVVSVKAGMVLGFEMGGKGVEVGVLEGGGRPCWFHRASLLTRCSMLVGAWVWSEWEGSPGYGLVRSLEERPEGGGPGIVTTLGGSDALMTWTPLSTLRYALVEPP